MAKYKITYSDLTSQGSIHKLERDGFSREQITKEMYKVTDGAQPEDRRKMYQKIYDRQPGEK